MIVVDASAVVEFLLRTPKGLKVAERIARDGGLTVTPHILDPEVMQAVRGLVRTRQLALPHAESALALFATLPVRRVPHDILRTRMWALRENLTAYDAAYVVVAELSRAPLVTCDGRLARSPGHRAKIELY